MELSQSLVLSIVKSDERFPVDFDDAWQWIGYNAKSKAKNKLVNNFEEEVDFLPKWVKNPQGGRPSESIKLTVDCFKSLAMMAGTEKGKEIRRYFLECERLAKEAAVVIPAQAEHIRELELVLQVEQTRLKLVERQDSMLTLHGSPVVLALAGKPDAIVEVEKATLEVIDNQHNISFKGQTLTQIKEYLEKRYGIRFKSGAEIKRRLERMGQEGLIAQTKRSVVSDYVPEENLDQIYRLLINGDRQMLLGEG